MQGRRVKTTTRILFALVLLSLLPTNTESQSVGPSSGPCNRLKQCLYQIGMDYRNKMMECNHLDAIARELLSRVGQSSRTDLSLGSDAFAFGFGLLMQNRYEACRRRAYWSYNSATRSCCSSARGGSSLTDRINCNAGVVACFW